MVVSLVRQRDCILMVLAQGPRRQIVVVADASDNSLLGAQGHIPRQLVPGSTYRWVYPVWLGAVAASSLGFAQL